VTAGYVWRLLVLFAATYLVFVALGRVKLAVIGLFGALVLTALLRPLVLLLARPVPRWLAVAAGMFLALVVFVGILAFAGFSIAGQVSRLVQPFQAGLTRLAEWLHTSPLHVRPYDLESLGTAAREWLRQHQGQLAGRALGGAATAAEILTGLALAAFCAVFFLHSGEKMWAWIRDQLPERTRDTCERAGRRAWQTFEGYVRGTILVALSNAVIVTLVLLLLRVPLALPLGLLVFVSSFIPLVGGPIALTAAALVSLASRGPFVALIVVILIPVIGQIEGHVLQPLIMSRSVKLHPVVVVLTVVCGGLLGGIVGAIVSVPIVSVGWAVISELRRGGAADLPSGDEVEANERKDA
jgi:predicted PurR-regulated permease PerM